MSARASASSSTSEARLRAALACAALAGTLAAGDAGPAPDPDALAARTAALARRIESRPGNAALARAVSAWRERLASDGAPALAARLSRLGLAPLRVPGLLYRSHPETGADLRAVPELLGVAAPLVETDELGSVSENARVVAERVRGLAGPRRAVVFSASKGSADVRAALEGDPSLGERVALWIDLVGVLEGTPLTEPDADLRAGALDWLPPATARSMSASVRKAAAAPERFPEATRAVHVAAFPGADDVSERARPSFAWLARLGPNDGYVLLEGYLRAPGRVLVVRGADHYLGARPLGPRLAALLHALLDELEAEDRRERAGEG